MRFVRRISMSLLILLGLYSVSGFLLVPYLVKYVANDQVLTKTGQILAIQSIDFNPFSFELKFDDISLKSQNATPHADIRSVQMQIDIGSIWSDTFILKMLNVDTVNLFSDVSENGDLVLLQLLDQFEQVPEVKKQPVETATGVLIQKLSVQNSRLFLKKVKNSENAKPLALGPVSLEINDFTTVSGQAFELSDLQIGLAGGQVSLEGRVTASPLGGDLNFTLKDIDLERVNQLATLLEKSISGIDRVSGKLHLAGAAKLTEIITATADINLGNLSVEESVEKSTILNLNNLALKAVEVNYSQASSETNVSVEKLIITRPHLNVKRLADGRMLIPGVSKNTAQETIEDTGYNSVSDLGEPQFSFTLHGLDVAEASLLFEDEMVTKAHAVTIDMISLHSGMIKFPFKAGNDITPFDMQARIGKQGQLNVEGQSRFDAPYGLDAHLKLDRLPYDTIAPYIRRYLGRDVTGGELFLDLDYEIPSTDIMGANIFLFNDWRWGGKVESEDAVEMPLDLAFSLLEGNDGRVKLEVPINGDLSDPSFEIGPILRQATGNLIAGLISSPFRLLGRLIPGDSNKDLDLSSVTFDTYSAELSTVEKAKLSSLAMSLKERPRLKLIIEGRAYEVLAIIDERDESIKGRDNQDTLSQTSIELANLRAEMIKSFLLNSGLDEGRLLIKPAMIVKSTLR